MANKQAYFDNHPDMRDFADGIIYKAHNGDQSVGRYPDGGTSIYKMSLPTIEKTNVLKSDDEYLGEDTGLTNVKQKTFELTLAEGWNWMSHPLIEPITVSGLSEYANRIVAKDRETIRDSRLGMTGALKELEAGHLYKVNMQREDTYTNKNFFCAEGSPIMLLPGWNWIGYTVDGTQTPSEAMANYMAEEGDKILGQSGFATYEDGTWQGTLSLEMGKGYMLYTTQAKTLTFKSPSTKVNFSRLHRRMSRAARTRSTSSFRSVSKHAYPNVMGVIAEVKKDNEKVAADRFMLYAYDADGECRGECKWVNGLAWMTLYGKGGEALSFRAVDLMDGTVYAIKETTSLAEGITGSVSHPFLLTLGQVDGSVAITLKSFDDQGYPVTERYLDADENRVLKPNGCSGINRTYSEAGDLVREVYRRLSAGRDLAQGGKGYTGGSCFRKECGSGASHPEAQADRPHCMGRGDRCPCIRSDLVQLDRTGKRSIGSRPAL